MRAWLTLVGVALITGCVFDGALPADAKLDCNNDDDCPDRQVCLGLVGRCIRASDFDGTAPALVDPLLSALLLGATSVLEISFAVDEPLLVAPLVRAGEATATPTLAADGARLATTMAGADIGAGLHAVTVVLVDASGNSGVGVIDVIEVDVTPPAIIDGTVAWSVSPPAGTAPVDVGALTLGSVAELTFRLDDRAAPAPAVAASGPTTFTFEHTSSSEGLHSYRFELREVPPDGAYTVEATLVDLLGNTVTVPVALPPPGFAFAEIEGPPCVARRGDGVAVCTDVDGDDHFGIEAACPEADDCDDTRALVHPGAREIPGDGIDDDCDGDDPSFDAARAVFLRPGAPSDAAGTEQDPLGDVAAALAIAAGMEQPAFVYAQGGALEVAGPIELSGPSFIGGLDEQWRRASALTELRVTSSGAPALIITGSARVEGVQIEGTFCEALAVLDAARSAEIARSKLHADGVGCTGGQFAAVYVDYYVAALFVGVRIDAVAVPGFAVASAFDVGGRLSFIDGDVFAAGGTTVIASGGNQYFLRAELKLDSAAFATGLFGFDATLIGSKLEATAAGGRVSLLDVQSATIFHSTLRAFGANPTALEVRNGATVIASLLEVQTGLNRIGTETPGPLILVGNAWAATATGCLVNDASGVCRSLDEVNACADAECVGSRDNVALAAGAATAATVAAIDLSAPSSIAMDLDGDCRGATGIEAGADELP